MNKCVLCDKKREASLLDHAVCKDHNNYVVVHNHIVDKFKKHLEKVQDNHNKEIQRVWNGKRKLEDNHKDTVNILNKDIKSLTDKNYQLKDERNKYRSLATIVLNNPWKNLFNYYLEKTPIKYRVS